MVGLRARRALFNIHVRRRCRAARALVWLVPAQVAPTEIFAAAYNPLSDGGVARDPAARATDATIARLGAGVHERHAVDAFVVAGARRRRGRGVARRHRPRCCATCGRGHIR